MKRLSALKTAALIVVIAGATAFATSSLVNKATEEPAKLYMVVYNGTDIGGTAGPLPYDMNECKSRQETMMLDKQETLDGGINRKTNKPFTVEEREKLENLRFECEWLHVRPSMKE